MDWVSEVVRAMCFWVGAAVCGLGAAVGALGLVWVLADKILKQLAPMPQLWRVVLSTAKSRRERGTDAVER